MEPVAHRIKDWILFNKSFYRLYSISLVVIGLTYIIIQFEINNQISDSLFVGLLFGSSSILLLGFGWVQTYFIDKVGIYFTHLDKGTEFKKSDFEKLLENVFNNPLVLLFSAVYGLVVSSAPFLFNIWNDNFLLNFLLSSFLFVVNFLTGAALFSLYKLFVFLYRTSKYLSIGLYDRSNPASKFVTDLSKRTSIIASFYIAFSITSIYFSKVPHNSMTYAYSIFASFVMVFAYILPMIPIRNKIKIQKLTLLDEVSMLLQKELNEVIFNAKTNELINLEKYNYLLEL